VRLLPKLVALFAFIAVSIRSVCAQTPGGTLDSTFGTGGIWLAASPSFVISAFDMEIAADGKVVVVGTALSLGTPANRTVVSRFNADGSLDTTFGAGGTVVATLGTTELHGRCISIAADGKVLVGGHSGLFFTVLRLTIAGVFDTTFGSGGLASLNVGSSAEVRGMTLQSDGKVILVGSALENSVSTRRNLMVTRMTAAGVVDSTFGSNGLTSIAGTDSRVGLCIESLAGGKLLVGGHQGTTSPAMLLARLHPTGALDSTFASGGMLINSIIGVKWISDMAVDGSGLIFAVGQSTAGDAALLRFTSMGRLDTLFSTDGLVTTSVGSTSDAPVGMVLRSDGRIVVASTNTSGATTDFQVMSYRPDGELETTFSTDGIVTTAIGSGYDTAAAIRQQSDGKLVVAGTAQPTAGSPTTGFAVARYHGGALEANVGPVIVTQPASVTLTEAQTATFSVVVSSLLVPNYQWFKGGVLIPNQTGASLVLSNVTLANEGSYTVEVSSAGGRITSSAAVLAITAPPMISMQPVGYTGPAGLTHALSVTVVGRTPLRYEWFKNGVSQGLSGPTSEKTHTLTVAQNESGAGLYHVIVTNSDGSAPSTDATVSVSAGPPILNGELEGFEWAADAPRAIEIGVSGRSPFTYQWLKNGKNFGAARVRAEGVDSLWFDPTPSVNGNYSCRITNADGIVTTWTVGVTFWPMPVVRFLFARGLARVGDTSLGWAAATWLTTEVRGYAWYKDGKRISWMDSSGTELRLDNVKWSDAGKYVVKVGTLAGSTTSNTMVIDVIESAPRSVVVVTGKTAQITAIVTGQGHHYLWKKDGVPLSSSGRYSGVNERTLTITTADAATDDGIYTCEVSFDPADIGIETGPISLFIVSAAPVISAMTPPAGQVAKETSISFAASNSPTKFVLTGYPSGMRFDGATGILSGAPLMAGDYTMKLTATNPVGPSAEVAFPWQVDPLSDGIAGSYLASLDNVSGGDAVGVVNFTIASTGNFTGKVTLSNMAGAASSGSFSGRLIATATAEPGELLGSSPQFSLSASVGGASSVILSYSSPTISVGLINLVDPVTGAPNQSLGSSVVARRHWDAKTRPATPLAGYYTCALPSPHSGYASGSGYASFTVSKAGSFTFAGKLSDNTSFAIPSFCDKDGVAVLHRFLYSNRGRLTGPLNFTGGSPPDYNDTGLNSQLSWTRPASKIVPLEEITVPTFVGFNGAIIQLVGARYLAPNRALLTTPYMMDLTGSPPSVGVTVEGGDLSSSASFNGVLSTNHVASGFSFEPGTHVKLGAITFTPSTGKFSGSFVRNFYSPDTGRLVYSRSVKHSGIVWRPSATATAGNAAGFFTETLYIPFYAWNADFTVQRLAQRVPVLFTGGISIVGQ
jgi:uncharacterized delta-60 repeat protein